ncbi:MAG TPA: helix-turn-helix domain-containing protein [Sphingopyxis sp.]|uniref:winged helix-turn-helix transcriptional regulator n=1 Tax=Sphingopyxis sp. TaxID=1908224 RepID=UPI002C47D685|nr:helix-turn-helix domain-containing protein [Sphingopyxis sp.]HWW57626.1 helix-turn-helix domain-containing protein [Sphingopyxis sp.]
MQKIGHQLPSNSARRALDILGDRWTLMILFHAFRGRRRFETFQSRTGMARSLLTGRLSRLVDAGVLQREQYQGRPPRYEYRLTAMGVDLFGASLMIIRWEKIWFPDVETAAHRLHHKCGHLITPELRCEACGEIVTARTIQVADGPGAGLEPPQPPRVQRRSTVLRDAIDPDRQMLERAMEVLGDRWTAHVIASAFTGVRKFGEFESELGVAPNILSERLNRLVDLGVLDRRLYQEKPERFEYRLTAKGIDLFPLIVELISWGDRWLDGGKGPPQILTHSSCGHRLVPMITCDHCHEVVTVTSTRLTDDQVASAQR